MSTLRELKAQLSSLEQQIEDNRPPRVTFNDQEDISDNYQENLEYGWWLNDVEAEIESLKEQIAEERINVDYFGEK